MQLINPNEDTRITQGSSVQLHFSVALENGVEIDNTRSRNEPVSLVVGDGNLLEGFEKTLLGLRAGDKRSASLAPTDAFGEWNIDNIQHFDTLKFETRPEIGTVLEFEDQGKNTLAGVVKSVDDNKVEVDFNHPLAGRQIVFEVEIFKVTPKGSSVVGMR